MLPECCNVWTIVIVSLISSWSYSTYGWVLPFYPVSRVSISACKSTLWYLRYLRIRICHSGGRLLWGRIHASRGRSVIWICSGVYPRSLYVPHISRISCKTGCNSDCWVVSNISRIDISVTNSVLITRDTWI